ncbi:4-hydroxy-tetrahydrodipicolinate reductase [Kroppenstedtia pulmonis]|uniref:4-hydroxy-tetrahydrodipicolinate reductase n=1 Tax=Kroppenstedtia pulmonis TaxID=1380685 RepID=A0A7D4C6D3_9BACL|nr:4-hydroxy-tetrahydrodipicolinate reductase [Kroppenstedtia pulmonis]QKG84356.1 4-hydroxy-tetrahydrodipicolinate reductase [Kroppenstedtia pulmonis]
MTQPIRIIIAGATGRMGQEAVKLVQREENLELAGAVSRSQTGKDVGEVLGIGSMGVELTDSLENALLQRNADVLLDLTTPKVVRSNTELAIQYGVRPVVGATGLSEGEIKELSSMCQERNLGGIIAPNFAIGAVLMMKFAAEAARYLPHVEIIEMHHDQKVDAPSGTALKTAELISQIREEMKQGHPEEKETLEGARGGYHDGMRVHSVRLPGLVAHQEVLFGGRGQLFTLRHDSMNRESFMPGVKLAVEKVMGLDHLVYGLENILE